MTVDKELYNSAIPIPKALELLGGPKPINGKIPCFVRPESNPSMHVYQDHLRCYGCGVGVDLIGLVGYFQFEQLLPKGELFWSVLTWIAVNAGIDPPEQDPELELRYRAASAISEVYEYVFDAALYHQKPALDYLEQRGIPKEYSTSIAGYLPQGLIPIKDTDVLYKAGLLSDKGYWLFDQKLVIPLKQHGKIVSLYGRSIAGDPVHVWPKKTQPPQPRVLWHNQTTTPTTGYLCEGIIDAMTLDCHGYPAYACIGARPPTDDMIQQLKQTGMRDIIICFDSDPKSQTGQKQALQAGRVCIRNDLETFVMQFPLGATKTDPNSFLLKNSNDAFDAIQRKPFFDLMIERIPSGNNCRLDDVAERTREAVAVWADQKDPIKAGNMAKRLRLVTGLDAKTLKDAKATIKSTTKELPEGDKFHPQPYVDLLKTEDQWICYNKKLWKYVKGVYVEQDDLAVQARIDKLVNNRLHPTQVEAVLKKLYWQSIVDPRLINPKGVINLLNGYLDLNMDTIKLLPHAPSLLSTSQLPIRYNRSADCPNFMQFLDSKCPDPELQAIVQELFGYCLIPDNSFQIGFIFVGGTSTGKSTLMQIFQELIGPDNRAALSLNELTEKFKVVGLDNKLVNISNEVSVKTFVDDGLIKAIISGDEITVEPKYKPAYSIRPHCRLIVTCNSLPGTKDTHPAFFRRWTVIPFNHHTPQAEWDKNLANRIIETELPGILNWALEGLDRLKENDSFSYSEAATEMLENWHRSVDAVRMYWAHTVHENPHCHVEIKHLYNGFVNWCDSVGRTQSAKIQQAEFKRRIEEMIRQKCERGRNGSILKGWLYSPDLIKGIL